MEDTGIDEPQVSTVASLKGQIESLRLEIEGIRIKKDPEAYLAYLTAKIDELLTKTSEQSLIIVQHEAEKEWINHKYPKYPLFRSLEILQLKEEIKSKTDSLTSAQENKFKDKKKLLEIQKLQKKDPKLYNLVQKLLQTEQKNFKLKQMISLSEDKKKDLRANYSKIATAFTQEESIKKKIKELSPQILEKEAIIKNLSKKIQITKQLTEDTIESIENSIVKEVIKKCSEVQNLRENLAATISSLQREYYELVYKIGQVEKNPEKIAPHVANQNLRQESKGLEIQITERSKEEKEKQKEKFQLTFNYENSFKELAGLKAKLELIEGKSEKVVDHKRLSKVNTLQSEKRVGTVESAGSRLFDAQRASVIDILGKRITDGMGEKVMKALKNVGKPGQGLASKVLELNRSQFTQSKSLIL